MVMRLAYVCILILAVSGCNPSGDDYSHVDLTATTRLTIGQDSTRSSHYLFGRIAGIAVDSENHIYVADQKAATIKVYDRTGRYLQSIGRRGHGPGEFQEITAVYVSPDNRLVVVDGGARRITTMSLSGDVRDVSDFSKGIEPYDGFYHWRRDKYLVCNLPVNRYMKNERDVFHIVNHAFANISQSFGVPRSVGATSKTDDALYSHKVGSATFINPDTFLFSPWIYRGELYEFSYGNNKWKKTDVISGVKHTDDPYTRLTPLPEPQSPTYNVWMSTLMFGNGIKEMAFSLHNESLGLFQLDGGDIIHFTLLKRNNKRVFGAEIYNSKGDLLGYGPIEGDLPSPRPRSANSNAWYLPLTIHAKDDDDTFYIEDTSSGIPTVRVVDIEYDITGSN